jgi:hypothetical protein
VSALGAREVRARREGNESGESAVKLEEVARLL